MEENFEKKSDDEQTDDNQWNAADLKFRKTMLKKVKNADEAYGKPVLTTVNAQKMRDCVYEGKTEAHLLKLISKGNLKNRLEGAALI